MFPKADDKSFKDKLFANHLGKSPNFGKPGSASKGKGQSDFELHHYAGVVSINNVILWEESNFRLINNTCRVFAVLENKTIHLSNQYVTIMEEYSSKIFFLDTFNKNCS